MALSQKHRVALYEHFAPSLGDEVTEALLSEFPAGDGDELVTKEYLRAEMSELRVEMHQLISRSNVMVIGAVGVMTAILAIFG
jgi:hypothetical protein